MKNLLKLFSIFSIIVVPSTSSSIITDNVLQNNQKILENGLLNSDVNSVNNYSTDVSVRLSDKVKTKALGANAKESSENAYTTISNKVWGSDFENTSNVNAYGYFNYGTYSDGKKKNDISLSIKELANNKRIWESDDTVDSWTGWAHHTSRILLKVEATNNTSTGRIEINVNYYIYARTAGAVHSCVTEINLNRLNF